MKYSKLLFGVLLWFVAFNGQSQTISPAILQKARSAGVSQSQIEAAMGTLGGTQRTGTISSQRIEAQQEEQELMEEMASGRTLPAAEIGLPRTQAGGSTRIFGKDLFQGKNLTFAPSFKQATPRSYVLGPEDELLIEVWGAAEMYTKTKVSPEGSINIRSVGPISVLGLTIDEAEKKIKSRVATVMSSIGTSSQLKISLSGVRSIKIDVVGEIENPGTYTISSFSSVFNALYAAGGVNEIGSLRNIKVFRNNVEIAAVDAYDFLLKGNSETNVRLQDNDVIIVPAYESYVSIAGNVKRAKIFELKREETLAQLLQYAGGFKGNAYTKQLQVVRHFSNKQILSVEEAAYADTRLVDADSVYVGAVTDFYVNKLAISGAVWRPGTYQLNEQTKHLSGLISLAEGLKGNEYGVRGLITRVKKDFTREVLSFDLAAVLDRSKDVELQTNDSIYIPIRSEMIEPYFLEILGEVNRPGTYTYEANTNIEDLIIRAKGLTSAASLLKLEVVRRVKDPLSEQYSNTESQRFEFRIQADLSLNPEIQKFILEPYDQVVVRRSPAYREQKTVAIEGEVLYPGPYQILKTGERISDLIKRSGGFTPQSYLQGVSLKRKMTKAQKIQAQAKLNLADKALFKKDSLMAAFLVDSMYSVGIDIRMAMKQPGGLADVVLKQGDVLFVPKLDNTVKISGAVLHTNSVVYTGGSAKKYIRQAGGYTEFADKRPYVVYMNGQISATKGWMFKRYPKIEPGCEVIVPIRSESADKMTTAEKLSLLLTASSTATVLLSLIRLL